jgi:CMP-N-acetylneuraminic acid synthetase
MKNINDIAFVVSARLSSERLSEKMIKPFCGTTLTDIIIEKMLKSSIVPKENIYLSACDKELIQIANKHDIKIYKRSRESSEYEKTLAQILEWHDKIGFKYYIMISGCCPLLKIETIDGFINNFVESEYDGLFAVFEKKNMIWDCDRNPILTEHVETLNTKEMVPFYEAAHCLYAGRTDWIPQGKHTGTFAKKDDPPLYVVGENEAFDIDYLWQFEMCEVLYGRKK